MSANDFGADIVWSVWLSDLPRHIPIKTKESKMKYEPLNDRILVKRIEADEVSEGGIIIPAQAVEKPLKGEVVAVGPGRSEVGFRVMHGYKESAVEKVPPDCKVGDIVIFGKYAGTEIKIDGVDHLVLREDDILLKESAE